MSEEFFDEWGLLHCNPNEISENGPLFTSEWLILQAIASNHIEFWIQDYARHTLFYVWNTKEKRWMDRAIIGGSHVSHDNLTGIYALGLLSKTKPWHVLSGLKRQPTYPRYFFHPRDRIFFALVERKLWTKIIPAKLILVLICIPSVMRPKQETSGKILWWLRFWCLAQLGSPLLYKVYLWALKLSYGQAPMIQIFKIYYPYREHPIHEIAQKVFTTEAK